VITGIFPLLFYSIASVYSEDEFAAVSLTPGQ
jgi:hypothetical protein